MKIFRFNRTSKIRKALKGQGETKKGHLKNAWRDYTYGLGISEKRMQSILSEFGKIEIKTVVNFTPA